MTPLVMEQYATDSNLSARIALHEWFSVAATPWTRWVFDQLQTLPPDADILEVGCGTASLWTSNAERIPRGWRIVLSDPSAGMLGSAGENTAAMSRQVRLARLHAQRLPFPADSFDCVIANHMLYHVPDLHRALGEFSRALRPGGRLFAATNGARHMIEIDDLVKSFDPAADYRKGQWRSGFSLENGEEILERHFESTMLLRFDDALLVSEAGPLADYIVSCLPAFGPRRATLAGHLKARIADCGGVLRLQKDSGIFEALKPEHGEQNNAQAQPLF